MMMAEAKKSHNQEIELPFTLSVIVTEIKSGEVVKPCVVLRRYTTDIDIMKQIIQAALNKVPLIIMPKFTDEIRSISSLIEKGILYRNADNGEYYFTI